MSNLTPSSILIFGGLLLVVLPGRIRKAASLIVPALALAAVWLHTDSLSSLGFVSQLVGAVSSEPAASSLIDPASHLKLAKLFATVFSLMAFTGALYALNQNRRVELPAAFVYAGSSLGVVFAADWLTLFIYWELMAIGSTLVIWASNRPGSRAAGLRYAAIHFLGGLLLLSGLALFALPGGNWGIGRIPLEGLGSWLVLVGMLVNAGAPPFGSWLPDAYPEASESGTVFLSAFTTKTAVFTLLITFAGEPILKYVGATMAVYGIVFAILENDMRRILAYSIINQVGFMVCGIGLGTEMSLNGTAAHAFAHIIYKALLLMSAGAVLYQTGRTKCTQLGGLYHSMPVSLWCGVIGALAISAFPLTSGFVSKSMISTAAHGGHEALVWFVLTAASAGVFLHAGIKFPWFVFFQKDSGLRPPDPPANMRFAMIFFAFLCLALGLFYGPLYAILPFETDYQPFTYAHVAEQLQLLLFSGLAFFVLLPLLKRTETLTLDFDWGYRRLGPLVWNRLFLPCGRAFVRTAHAVQRRAARILSRDFELARVDGWLLEGWPIGQAVLLITLVLCGYMIINLIDWT